MILAGCDRIIGDHRFKITFVVNTPDGPREGTAIWRAFLVEQTGPGPRYSARFQGEAIFVALGGGKHAILTFGRGVNGDFGEWSDIWLRAYGFGPGFGSTEQWTGKQPVGNGRRLVDRDLWGTVVSFRDLNDPDSFQIVYANDRENIGPDRYGQSQYRPVVIDRASEILGPGYSIEGVYLAIIPAGTPLTKMIERQVPFLVSDRERLRSIRRDLPRRYITDFTQFIRSN
jgi:hypothetical protein